MLTAAAGMQVDPSSPLAKSIAAMWCLPILNMGALPLLGFHFQRSSVLASAQMRSHHARLSPRAVLPQTPIPCEGSDRWRSDQNGIGPVSAAERRAYLPVTGARVGDLLAEQSRCPRTAARSGASREVSYGSKNEGATRQPVAGGKRRLEYYRGVM